MTKILDYIGAKNKLAPTFVENIEKHTGNLNGSRFVDLFAGTGAISRWLLHNRNLKSITTNDFEFYSFAVCLATTKQIFLHRDLYKGFNILHGRHGFITNTCSLAGPAKRMFFTEKNARIIDTIRSRIKYIYDKDIINFDQLVKLSGELTIAADRVSNTASVYGAYLKEFKKTALKKIEIRPMEPDVRKDTMIWNGTLDANDAILTLSGDILYVDPPYTSRQYGNNYHVLNYIADPWAEGKYVPRGVTGVPENWQRSMYCDKRKVTERFDHLIKNAKFQYIAISYSDQGILPLAELEEILDSHGKILEIKQIEYPSFKADNSREYKTSHTTEYMIILKKDLAYV